MSPVDVTPVAELDTVNALHACAWLLCVVAALGGAVDPGRICVGAGLGGLTVQVARDGADEADRIATVATYADVLGAVVARKGQWVNARGVWRGHAVHVWTIIGAVPDADTAGVATAGVA